MLTVVCEQRHFDNSLQQHRGNKKYAQKRQRHQLLATILPSQ